MFAKMVGRIVQSRFPTYVSFVEFPPCFTHRLSYAAWLIEPSGLASNVDVVIPWLATPFGYTEFAGSGAPLSGCRPGAVPRLPLRWFDPATLSRMDLESCVVTL